MSIDSTAASIGLFLYEFMALSRLSLFLNDVCSQLNIIFVMKLSLS